MIGATRDNELTVEQAARRLMARRIVELRRAGQRSRNAIYGILVAEACRDMAVHDHMLGLAKRHFVGWQFPLSSRLSTISERGERPDITA